MQKIRNVVLEEYAVRYFSVSNFDGFLLQWLRCTARNHSSRAYNKINEMFKDLQSDVPNKLFSGKRVGEKLHQDPENKVNATTVEKQPRVQFEQSKTQGILCRCTAAKIWSIVVTDSCAQ